MAQTIDKIIKSPYPPKSDKVLWLDKNVLKAVVNGEWKSVSNGSLERNPEEGSSSQKLNILDARDFYFLNFVKAYNIPEYYIYEFSDIGLLKMSLPLTDIINISPEYPNSLVGIYSLFATDSDMYYIALCPNLQYVNLVVEGYDGYNTGIPHLFNGHLNIRYVYLDISEVAGSVDFTSTFCDTPNLKFVEIGCSEEFECYITDLNNAFDGCQALSIIFPLHTCFLDARSDRAFANTKSKSLFLMESSGNITSAREMFRGSQIELLMIPYIDFLDADVTGIFAECYNLKLFSGLSTNNSYSLEDSPLLTEFSLQLIVGALSRVSSSQSLILHADAYKKLSELDKANAVNKGWNIISA